MRLEIDSERVKKAAESCPDAARVLKKIFPEAFKKEFDINEFSFRELLNEPRPTIVLEYKRHFILTISELGIHRMPLPRSTIECIPIEFTHDIVGERIKINE